MIRRLADPSCEVLAAFDAVIDARSPSEFAHDHLPGAINLPVLDDAQRAEVGTEYVQGSKFLARRQGAALVARNIASHLDGALADRTGGFKPLIYCWRGGQRSHAMATVMDQVGWPVTLLDGGYKTWRRAVVRTLYDQPVALRMVRLDGPTGVGKTAMLDRLSEAGVQTLDLEALANHRGSLFGAMPGGQPSQKLFESRLHAAINALDPARPVAVEAEASRIGRVTVPPSLWAAMAAGPVIALTASLDERVARTVRDYAAFANDLPKVADLLGRLPRHHSKVRRAEWLEMARARDLDAFVRSLLIEHYDPAYARSAGKSPSSVGRDDLEAVLKAVGALSR